jgi:hypothetical protein
MNPQDYEHFAAGLDDDAGLAVAINSVAANARSTGASSCAAPCISRAFVWQ